MESKKIVNLYDQRHVSNTEARGAEDNKLLVTLSVVELKGLIQEAVREAMIHTPGRVEDAPLLNVEQASKFLGFGKDWVYRHWKKIGGRKLGPKGLRFTRKNLEVWIASRRMS